MQKVCNSELKIKETPFERPIPVFNEKKKSSNPQPQGRGQNLTSGQSAPESFSRSLDSIQKLAKESLHIGKLLGVTVVQTRRQQSQELRRL